MTDMTDTFSPGIRTVTAFFDTNDAATRAKTDLIAAGLPESDITIVGSGSGNFTVQEDQHRGFWDTLASFFMPFEDRRAYEEGLRRGGFAISVKTDEALYDKAIDVLDRDGAVDLDERAMNWEREGWTRTRGGVDNVEVTPTYKPADASTAGFGGSFAGEDGFARVDEATNPDVRERIGAGTASQSTPAAQGGPHTYTNPADPATDQRADVATGRSGDPDLLARRDLEHGRTRVRSYIVENDFNR